MNRKALWVTVLAAAAVLPPAAQASDERHILNVISSCLIEYAPDDWETLIVTVEESIGSDGKKQVEFDHQVVVGNPGNPPKPLKSCLPLFVPGKLNELRSTLPVESRGWVKATLTIQRSGSFELDYKQPGS